MTVEEINSRVKSLNAVVHKKNEERQMLLGRKQALEAQYNEMVQKYKAETGVDLTVTSLEDEVNRVVVEKTEQVQKLERVIALIDAGNYTEAENLINSSNPSSGVVQNETVPVSSQTEETKVETEPVVQQTQPVEEKTTPVVQETAPVEEKPTPVVQETVAVEQKTAPVAEPKVAPPVGDVVAPPISKPTGVTPPKSPVNSFSAILGGSAFKPNNGN